MSTPALLVRGGLLPLGDRIGRGGEGEIYAIGNGSALAVKVYLHPDHIREAKVNAVVAARLGDSCPNVAFPLDIARYPDGRFAGFTMRRIKDHQPIHELIAPGSRREFFPHADPKFLLHVAVNVARIVATTHANSVVLGDLNSAGFLVSRDGTVTLIDADSFQIGPFRCRVGMPEYTPPELQGVRFDTVDRTIDHDNFGLAILIFQILALGRHPFAGARSGRPVPLETAITKGQFAYSLIRSTQSKAPPNTLQLTDFPPGVRLLFERAFAHGFGKRPMAADWVRELNRLETTLIECPVNDSHFVYRPNAPCPWCRIERGTGKSAFRESTRSAERSEDAVSTRLHRAVGRAISRAKQIAGEAIEPSLSHGRLAPSEAAQTLASALNRGEIRQEIALRSTQTFIDRHAAAAADKKRMLDDWRTALGVWDIYKNSSMLEDELAKIDNFINSKPYFLKGARDRFVAAKSLEIMQANKLSEAVIPGIGSGVRLHLAKHGIKCAADITRSALATVSGLGEKRIFALLLWHDEMMVEAEQHSLLSATSLASVEAAESIRINRHIAHLEQAITGRILDLESDVTTIRNMSAIINPKVREAIRALDQAVVDLKHLGIGQSAQSKPASLANSTVVRSLPRPVQIKAKTKNRKPANCPRCGAPMVKRWAQSTQGGSSLFFGCSKYPQCNGSRPARQARVTP